MLMALQMDSKQQIIDQLDSILRGESGNKPGQRYKPGEHQVRAKNLYNIIVEMIDNQITERNRQPNKNEENDA